MSLATEKLPLQLAQKHFWQVGPRLLCFSALPIETKVESGTSLRKSGTSVD
jgi:hypothetical protein